MNKTYSQIVSEARKKLERMAQMVALNPARQEGAKGI